MGGMYNMLFGNNPAIGAILAVLDLEAQDFGRLRDAFVMGGEIVVYTRCGGGNRPSYKEVFEKMAKHPDFLREEDDSFDSTYCTFYFRFPEEWKEHLEKINLDMKWDPAKLWKDTIANLEKMPGLGGPEAPQPISDTGVDGKKGMV